MRRGDVVAIDWPFSAMTYGTKNYGLRTNPHTDPPPDPSKSPDAAFRKASNPRAGGGGGARHAFARERTWVNTWTSPHCPSADPPHGDRPLEPVQVPRAARRPARGRTGSCPGPLAVPSDRPTGGRFVLHRAVRCQERASRP